MKKFGVGVGTRVFPRNKFQAVQDEGEGQGCWVPKWTGLENRSPRTDRQKWKHYLPENYGNGRLLTISMTGAVTSYESSCSNEKVNIIKNVLPRRLLILIESGQLQINKKIDYLPSSLPSPTSIPSTPLTFVSYKVLLFAIDYTNNMHRPFHSQLKASIWTLNTQCCHINAQCSLSNAFNLYIT